MVTESVNVVFATSPEVSPVVVNCSVMLASSAVTYQVVVKFPFVSAVTVQGACSFPTSLGAVIFNTCNWTVSPGAKPLPVMLTVLPGG